VKEIERIADVDVDPVYQTSCKRCGREIELWFNGGELDERECCGLIYGLVAPRIDFVVAEIGSKPSAR